jgi:alkylation response protein AidB-like acyl-CoA dehydrogenase
MDFSLSEEQSMLADSIARFIDNDYDFEKRQKIAESEKGYSPELWQTYAELGWTAVPFSEDDDGLGGGPIELMLMMEQFGRGLVVEPFLATIVLAGGVLRRAASAEQKEQWLSGIIDGSMQAALAFSEPQGRFEIANIATSAKANGDKYILNGQKNLVLNGANDDLLIIPARTSGSQSDENGITLFVRLTAPASNESVMRPSTRITRQTSHSKMCTLMPLQFWERSDRALRHCRPLSMRRLSPSAPKR